MLMPAFFYLLRDARGDGRVLKPLYRLNGLTGAGSLGARFGKFGVPGPGTSTGFL